MAIQTIAKLKAWFRKGLYPTEGQFADLIDSFRHKSEKMPIADVTGLTDALNKKYDSTEEKILETKVSSHSDSIKILKEEQENQGLAISEIHQTDENQQKWIDNADLKFSKIEGRLTTGYITYEEMLGMEPTDYLRIDSYKPGRLTILKNGRIIGILDLFLDEVGHGLMQVVHSSYNLIKSNLETSEHTDGSLFVYYRYYSFLSPNFKPGWTDWEKWEPEWPKDGILSEEDKKKVENLKPSNLIAGISFQDMLNMDPTDLLSKGDSFHAVYLVENVGTLQVFTDNMLHQVTQVLCSNYNSINDKGETSHIDGKIFLLYRCYGLGTGGNISQGWSEWKIQTPDVASINSDGLLSKEDKKKLDGSPETIKVNMSCRDKMFERSIPRLAEEPSAKSSGDEGVMTVVLDSFYDIKGQPVPGVYLYDEETGEIYTEWADSDKFVAEGQQWIPGKFYRSDNLDLFYASKTSVNSVAPSLTVESLIGDIENLSRRLQTMENTLNGMPKVTEKMKTDNKVYALVNGDYEEICPEGYAVAVYPESTAATLEADGSLKIPVGVDALIQSAKSKKTKDVEPSKSDES